MGGGSGFWKLFADARRSSADQNSSVAVAELRGKRIAVDLTYWLVVLSTGAYQTDQHPDLWLRNLFYRVVYLASSRIGAHPVFVLDGVPHELKHLTRAKRFAARTGAPVDQQRFARGSKVHGRHFHGMLMRAKELLQALGLPVLQAPDEGEALCAQLQAVGLVDAVVASDADAFAFGATLIYKDFDFGSSTMSSKINISRYSLSDVPDLNQDDIIACLILSGCDFWPCGASQVGPSAARALVTEGKRQGIWNGDSVLPYLMAWSHGDLSQTKLASEPNRLHRKTHCGCGHQGSRQAHRDFGCSSCNFEKGCRETSKAQHPCPCSYCTDLSRWKAQGSSRKIVQRLVALGSQDSAFPELLQNVIALFKRKESVEKWETQCQTSEPDIDKAVAILEHRQVLGELSSDAIREKIIPLSSQFYMLRQPHNSRVIPARLLKFKVRQFCELGVVEWITSDGNFQTEEWKPSLYQHLPSLVKKYETEQTQVKEAKLAARKKQGPRKDLSQENPPARSKRVKTAARTPLRKPFAPQMPNVTLSVLFDNYRKKVPFAERLDRIIAATEGNVGQQKESTGGDALSPDPSDDESFLANSPNTTYGLPPLRAFPADVIDITQSSEKLPPRRASARTKSCAKTLQFDKHSPARCIDLTDLSP